MKKTLLLLSITLCALGASAQKSVLFKMKYMPQHNYVSNMLMDMNMEMNIKADSATLEKMTAAGQKFPMLMQMKSDMVTTMRVGTLNKDRNLPVSLSYDKMNSSVIINGKEIPTPPSPVINQKVTGNIINEKLQLDSVSGTTMTAEQKAALTGMINKMISQIQFPDKPLSIGESFTQDVPMDFPVAGNSFQMAIKVIYKLVSIKDNIAYFDIDQSLSADMTTPENLLMHMKGQGDGKLAYSIKDSYLKNMTSNLKFSYDMDIKEITMTGKSDITTTYAVDIKRAD